MKTIILIMLLGQFSKAYEPTEAEKAEMRVGLGRWEAFIVESDSLPRDEAILRLSEGLLKTTIGSVYVVPERLEVREKLQTKLLSIPGHAEYFGNLLKATPRNHNRRYWFQYLQNLPSPETVRVLGEQLSDDSERPAIAEDRSNMEEYLMANPNCDRAVKALSHLLDNPPVPKGSDYEFHRDLETWRLWWERVKVGKQTFRFEGDPTEYDLNGPASKEKLERIDRDRKRDAERVAGKRNSGSPAGADVSPSQDERPKPVSIAALIALCLLLAVAVWSYVSRKSNNATGQPPS